VNTKLLYALVFLGPAAIAACSSSSKSAGDAGMDGPSDAIVSTPCPGTAPAQGAACTGASSCPYGSACSQTVSVCTGGFWENSPAVVLDGGECPLSIPANGADCTICPSTGPCTYNTTCDPEAGASMATASCTSGHWSVAMTLCPFDAGIPDVGPPDAMGDAPSDVHDADLDAPDAREDAAAH
jgi:hypothetical protein